MDSASLRSHTTAKLTAVIPPSSPKTPATIITTDSGDFPPSKPQCQHITVPLSPSLPGHQLEQPEHVGLGHVVQVARVGHHHLDHVALVELEGAFQVAALDLAAEEVDPVQQQVHGDASGDPGDGVVHHQLLGPQLVGVGVEGQVGVHVVAARTGDGDGTVDVVQVVGDEADAGVVAHVPGQVICRGNRRFGL